MKHVPVAFRLGEHHEHRGLEPGCHLFTSSVLRGRRREYSLVRYDREKLMYARPRKRPWCVTFGKLSNTYRGPLVPWAITTMGVHEQVCI